VSIRRLFWLGAAVLFSVAALVAIAAVLGGGFGTTQQHILETCGIAFVCGAASLAGLACIDRGVIGPVGWVTVLLAALIVTTLRLLASSPRLLSTVVPWGTSRCLPFPARGDA
jgi:hypothetical protein